jgi:predicted phage tail protein
MLKQLKKPFGGRLKTQVTTAGEILREVEWTVNLFKSKLEDPAGIIMVHKLD